MDADVVVVGAGAVGASAAAHLARQGQRVVVVEKEAGPAAHQSGRNSGVIHAGYNLKPGSQKARYCVEGSRRLRAYCRERGIAMQQGGILVVASRDGQRDTLGELARRSAANGVQARLVEGDEIPEIEPYATGVAALHAPEGASLDARGYVHALCDDAMRDGARFLFDARVTAIDDAALAAPDPLAAEPTGVRVETDKGTLRAHVLVNAAGLHADRVAGVLARDLRVVPFRGYYAELALARSHLVRSHVYAAPDLRFPFLGGHLSRRVDGRVIVGPGAMLAFGREAYTFWRLRWRDLGQTLAWPGFWRMVRRPEFRSLIPKEVRKSLDRRAIAREVQALVPEIRERELVGSYAGNRAQLVDRGGRLVDDMVVRETANAVHVLNAVSPGLTASLPFGEDLARRCLDRL